MPFLIRPYIPRGGTILLYGKTSIGKSPLTWEMARCVGGGEDFYAHPAAIGRVLYLEFDTPKVLVQPRVRLIESPPSNVWWEFLHPCHIVTDGRTQTYLRELQGQCLPDFVVVNTLRRIHQGDEKDGSLPTRIYSTFQAIFPGAACLFVHHDKKTPAKDQVGDPDEAFSGHQAWWNDATTGLHLVRTAPQTHLLRLDHTKSQVSEQAPPLLLQLHKDGTHLLSHARATEVSQLWSATPGETKSERVAKVAQTLGISERNVWRYLSLLESGT